MDANYLILVINPGSTSTKIALFDNEKCVSSENLSHSVEEISKFESIYEQKEMRTEVIMNWLKEQNVSIESLAAVVGRGGLLRPMPGGVYKVTGKMLEDLKIGYQAQHASNLGGIIAHMIAGKVNIPAYIVDPVAVDEIQDVARISGLPEIPRRSLVHALNIKAVTRRVCNSLDKTFDKSSFVVAHIGGGISIAPVKNGKIIDVDHANAEGPFSTDRTGGLPVGDLIKLCYSGQYTYDEVKKKLIGQGGLTAYLGTNDGREVNKRIDEGDRKAEFILNAMSYQIAKTIGSMAVQLEGKIDGIILTGGMAYNKKLTDYVEEMVKFIAPVILIPGEEEMLALAQGALRALKGEEIAKVYEEEVFIND
ncbi:butyrate kinase [Clostridium thailandense]|uniref:Probable butyrate kinase n=1 Tax=Clostridium thailandense TaxID=2794346 RepID=A0A949TSM4_9CLOT|nr:butyrate kinase [Clostridium thailandense]MBV7271568.1 butyrate kinase [Clostridium thailandense]MCH5136462.1 butyrate kinase [Clostridiaceae bacterium UIB06]